MVQVVVVVVLVVFQVVVLIIALFVESLVLLNTRTVICDHEPNWLLLKTTQLQLAR